MTYIDIENIEKILRQIKPKRIPPENGTKRAAVSLILDEVLDEDGTFGTSIFFIKRSERKNDPWSGHMALPGGREEKNDADILDTAIRETYEEIGIDLRRGKILGMLDEVQSLRRPELNLIITPFVAVAPFDIKTRESDEVAEVIKIPISQMKKRSGKAKVQGTYQSYSTYHYNGYTIWGLTAWILDQFFSLVPDF